MDDCNLSDMLHNSIVYNILTSATASCRSLLICLDLCSLHCSITFLSLIFRLDALALSVIATATWLAGWLGGCPSQPVLYQND